MPSLLGGILHGFNKVAAQGRADAAAREEKQSQREFDLLHELALNSENTQIADAAASAVLDIVSGKKRPKGGYWNRLIGVDEESINPAVTNIMGLIRQQQQGGGEGAGPSRGPISGGGGGVAPATGSGAGGTAPRPAVVAPPPAPRSVDPGFERPEPPVNDPGFRQPGPSVNDPGFARPVPLTTGRPGSLAQSPTALGQPGGTPPDPGKLAGPPSASIPGPMGGKVQMPQMGQVQPPPQVNQPPDAGQAVVASANTIGPLLQPPPSVMDTLSQRTQIVSGLIGTPSQRQRMAYQRQAEGVVIGVQEMQRGWDLGHPNATPEERELAHAQIEEKAYGTAPNWKPIAGTVTRDRVPPNAVDATGQPFNFAAGSPTDNYVLRQAAGNRIQAIPTTGPKATGPEAQAMERAREIQAENPGMSPEAALQQARVESRDKARVAAAAALERLQGTQLTNEQRADVLNGVLKPAEALRIAAQLLSQQPNVTLGQVEDLAQQLSNGSGQAPVEPPVASAAGAAAGPSPNVASRTVSRETRVGKGLTADTQKILETISESRGMIARVKEALKGREANNSMWDILKAGGNYAQYSAHMNPSDPLYQELIPLTSLLKVFLTTPYMKGMRNLPYVKQIQTHLPDPLDTPALILDKIKNIETSLAGIEAGAREGDQPTPAASATAPTTPSTASAPSAGSGTQTTTFPPNHPNEDLPLQQTNAAGENVWYLISTDANGKPIGSHRATPEELRKLGIGG